MPSHMAKGLLLWLANSLTGFDYTSALAVDTHPYLDPSLRWGDMKKPHEFEVHSSFQRRLESRCLFV